MMNVRRLFTSRNRSENGSALLVSLMVMVGLSLLGLGFVVISETENSISANERNTAQVLAVAEAGAKVALEWFQDPAWANARIMTSSPTVIRLLPANINDYKILRQMSSTAPNFPNQSGRYKDTGGHLFDKPFKPQFRDRFFGDEQRADVIINASTAAGTAYLAALNAYLFPDLNNGQITDIRIYAPPIMSGTLNGNGFWEGGTRYGLATIRVTARKIVNSQTVAERVVKLVISEWPFPGPQGPVQSNANISTGGSFGVHWGRMTSEGTMEIKKPLIGMPWFDAWNSLRFEHGYAVAGQDTFGNANSATDFCSGHDWLYKVIYNSSVNPVEFEDLWYEARAKGNIINAVSGTTDHPFKVTATTDNLVNTPNKGWSNWFQNQNADSGTITCGARNKKIVLFPKIDYEFWKALSQSASSSTSGVKYLRWVAGENYTDGIETKNVAQWINTVTGAKPGFYFFDTRNGLNPQGSAAAGVLTPKVLINSSDDGPTLIAKGFVYLNSEEFGTSGINGPGGYYNFPGEPFRDIGYWEVNTAVTPFAYKLDGGGNKIVKDANNGEWNYQDLNGNNQFDEVIGTRTVNIPGGGTLTNERFLVPWTPGCTLMTGCSEPHEPYLNLIYPSIACCSGGGSPSLIRVGWEANNNFTKRAWNKTAAGAPTSNCTGNTYEADCTSNKYDKYGALTQNFGNQPNTRPILDGVIYNEGRFDTQGNAAYYGSLLFNGNIVGTGTPEVWFDECLVKGCWEDKFKELPRVFVTSHETEQ